MRFRIRRITREVGKSVGPPSFWEDLHRRMKDPEFRKGYEKATQEIQQQQAAAKDPVCPECGGEVFYTYTCHTYKVGERWSSCLPCDSALDYDCYAEDCGWGYTHGLNPHNPRFEGNEKRRPGWLPEGAPAGYPLWTHPQVSHAYDRDE